MIKEIGVAGIRFTPVLRLAFWLPKETKAATPAMSMSLHSSIFGL